MLADVRGVVIEDRTFDAQDQQSFNGFVFRMAQHIGKPRTSCNPAKDRDVGCGTDPQQKDDRQDYRNKQPVQDPEGQHSQHRKPHDKRFIPADPEQVPDLLHVDKAGDSMKHDHREDHLRKAFYKVGQIQNANEQYEGCYYQCKRTFCTRLIIHT